MSAPMENIGGELKVEITPELPEELDLSSPNLDPLKVLYAENVHLPSKNPTLFNNLAEYENVVIRGRTRSSLLPGRGRGRARMSIILEKQVVNESSSHDWNKDSGEQNEAIEQARQRRENRNRNVLTRMSSFDKGPLTILRRAVEEHLRVKVWTRSAVTYRGYCKAFLIAFDKHFNLALMDVDETYRLPKVTRKQKRHKDETTKPDDNSNIYGTGPNHKDENSLGSIQQISQSSELKSDEEDTDSRLASSTEKLSIKKHSKIKTSLGTSGQQTGTDKLDIRSKCNSSEDIPSCSSNSPETGTITGSSLPTVNQDESEIEYITKHRHVNQLFVRGDNVVSVMLLD